MAGMSVARCMGIEQDWASVVPSAVNRLAEASSPSLTMGEKELRSSVDCISLAMPSSLCRMTSMVIGSKDSCWVMGPLSSAGQDQGAVRGDAPAPAGLDERRRIDLLDDGRAVDLGARGERGAAVDRGLDEARIRAREDSPLARLLLTWTRA